jgi:putative ABC transport system substrate-binding protein
MPVVGFLNGGTESGRSPRVAAFRQGLGKVGYVEGRNVGILFRWAEYRNDRLPALAADFVDRKVSVIVTTASAGAALTAKAATTIPIVFELGVDPVALGLVATQDRGRDAHCWAPPAQIRTGPIRASGSYLGCLTAKR